MQNITTRELKHLCNFLTHAMNYKVELVSEEDWEAFDEFREKEYVKIIDKFMSENGIEPEWY